MLAYVFWHRPRPETDTATYEEAQWSFHASLESPSASFRLAELPFAAGDGYEDWYLVDNWQRLGELNVTAVDPTHRPHHDKAASMAVDGWGGVYALLRGPAAIPDGAEWRDKPRRQSYEEFVASLPEATVWQRQMVLGPAPEFCLAAPGSEARTRIWPIAE